MINADDCCLIVEDNFVILIDLEDMVQSMGFKQVDHATNLTEAMALIEKKRYRVAFLDIRLGKDNGLPIAKALQKHEIPFAITSAYYDESSLPPEFHRVPLVAKPYSMGAVRKALADLLNFSSMP